MNEGTTNPPIWLELAAALLVPAAVVGFSRVFELSDTVMPIIGASLVSSAVAVMCRRLRLPLAVAAALSLSLLALLLMNRYAPATARFGILPTGATFDQFQALVNELVVGFREMQSPVPAVPAFVASAIVGAWLMAFLTDWGAMRLQLAFEPVFPSTLLFVFTSIPPISAGQNRVLSTFIYASAVAAWSVAQRVHKLTQDELWLPNHERRGPMAVGRLGATLATLSVVLGTMIGANLPWADAEAVYSFSPQQDPTRKVISPYVNLRSRLVEQTDLELFTVVADEPSYWRMAGLDLYQDEIWKINGNFSSEDGDLPGLDIGGSRKDLTQTFQITALEAIWLPAAFAPARIEEADTDVTWNRESSSLTVSNEIPDSDGVTYTVLSKVPAFSPDELRSASEEIPDEIAERFLDLPGDLTSQIAQQAATITAGTTSRYDQMLTLQEHFRQYEYSVQLGDRGDDPIETFLQERRGFCQQFSGTFALMARALGVPSRVATGFTWGEQGTDEQGRTTYTVTGRHTHAWPEVYFAGIGWVPFEPTPGRGLPGASPYTGHTPEQDSTTESPVTETPLSETPVNPLEPDFDLESPGEFDDPAEVAADSTPLWKRLNWRYLVLPAAVIAYVALMLGYWSLRRTTRRSRSETPDEQVTTAWSEAVEDVELGFEQKRRPSETRTEFAGRLRDQSTPGGDVMQRLAELSTVARFHPGSVSDSQVEEARGLADQVEAVLNENVPSHTRLVRKLDPRRSISLPHLSDRRITSESKLSGISPSADGDDGPSGGKTSGSSGGRRKSAV